MGLDQDVTIEIGNKEYTLILNTVALSRFEEWLTAQAKGKYTVAWMAWWQNLITTANESGRDVVYFPLRDGLYLLWCALQEHHKKEFRNVDAVAAIVENPIDMMGGNICIALMSCWHKHLPTPDEEEKLDEGDGVNNNDEGPLPPSETGGT